MARTNTAVLPRLFSSDERSLPDAAKPCDLDCPARRGLRPAVVPAGCARTPYSSRKPVDGRGSRAAARPHLAADLGAPSGGPTGGSANRSQGRTAFQRGTRETATGRRAFAQRQGHRAPDPGAGAKTQKDAGTVRGDNALHRACAGLAPGKGDPCRSGPDRSAGTHHPALQLRSHRAGAPGASEAAGGLRPCGSSQRANPFPAFRSLPRVPPYRAAGAGTTCRSAARWPRTLPASPPSPSPSAMRFRPPSANGSTFPPRPRSTEGPAHLCRGGRRYHTVRGSNMDKNASATRRNAHVPYLCRAGSQ